MTVAGAAERFRPVLLTATVASFFLQEHADANKEQLKAAHEQSQRIGRLLHAGQLSAQVILLRRPWE